MEQARKPAVLMIQGTGSDVGKSLIVAGLGRAYSKRGLRVRPFKPQNMSNNAAVTVDGGEIGRAQALQARACGVDPISDMNPVLLKPQSEGGSQVIVQGRVFGQTSALGYAALKPVLMPRVLESFDRLGGAADLVLVEGAGSPAEVNLREGDIANMGFAEAADLPVVLVGDVHRGGVLAAIVGTHTLLEPSERARLKGYVVNMFRGDVRLFHPALDIIRDRTGLDCFGIVPYFAAARQLPAEDSMALDRAAGNRAATGDQLNIVVPRLPRLSNFDDLDPLLAEPGVFVRFIEPGNPLPRDADLVLLPGSKATIADLASLREQGWDIDIAAHVRAGGHVLGLCGGYQMLGRSIADPEGIEGIPGTVQGLGLLDVDTVFAGEKRLVSIEGDDEISGHAIEAYEMHMGVTSGPDTARPLFRIDGRDEGARSADGLVSGCYLHGVFASDAWRRQFIAGLGGRADEALSHHRLVESVLDGLAAHLEAHLDLDRLWEIANGR
jgi:adenosylcobyric acid synthase